MLKKTIYLYSELEIGVQRIMNAQCYQYCAICRTPCCKIDFCQESMQSPFLDKVRNQLTPATCWDPDHGWLTPKGCKLAMGRPPVCYEFICQTISNAQPTALMRDALHQLGMLLTIAGRRAAGARHLVEVADLNRLNHRRVMHQLHQALKQLESLKSTAFLSAVGIT